jgi:PTH1 family peptidyl-tRNA hydrolase
MNESGSVIYTFLHNKNDKFCVVVDDINLPLGRMRMRKRGSDGGHRGLRSIIEELGTQNFSRLRIGIGQSEGDVAEYVLSSFERKERKLLKKVINEAITGIKILVETDFISSQNYINSINIGDID